jgi:AcrR family transcriptional regulator
VLRAALELFTKKGYAATSVREIVSAAGVTKPVLYYYFSSKEGLYLEIMRPPFAEFEAFAETPIDENASATEAILDFCDSVFRLFVENIDVARLMYSIYYGPPQGAPFFDFDAAHSKLQAKVRALFEIGMRTGEFEQTDPVDMTWALLGALTVAMEEHLSHKDPRLDGGGLERVLRLILGKSRPT